MTRFGKDRMALVPGAGPVPEVAVLEKQFIDFWSTMRGNLYDKDRRGQLSYSERSYAKKLASRAHERRCREAGLGSVEDKKLPGLLTLIRDGGRLSGPSRADDVHRLVADLHAESPWMRDVSSWIMNQMLQHIATGGHGFALPPMILAGPPVNGGVKLGHMAAQNWATLDLSKTWEMGGGQSAALSM